MKDALDITALGQRLRSLRLSRGLSLQDLSQQASVSVSMLSAVERGEKVASIQLLHQIALALKTSVGRLIGEGDPQGVVILRRGEQAVVSDDPGWARRLLSPALPALAVEMSRTRIEPGVEAGTYGAQRAVSQVCLAVEDGVLSLILDGRILELETGDSITYGGNSRAVFRNDREIDCVYYLCVIFASA